MKRRAQQFGEDYINGEASSIAIAIHRGLTFVSDDKRAIKKAKIHNIRVLEGQDFYREWIQETGFD